MNVALDTNVVAYASGVNDTAKQYLALDVLDRMPQEWQRIPVQVLGELFRVLVRKAKRSAQDARRIVLGWRNTVSAIPTTEPVLLAAIELATRHQLAIWDAVVLAAAVSDGCAYLLSEDMHEGFTWGGVTIINPMKRPLHRAFETILSEA
jgi:predicted nucleic acid-binding protein